MVAILGERRCHPAFRKFITVVSIIGVVSLILLFLTLVNLTTLQPKFCELCHQKVYKRWSTSTHARVNCSKCHIRPGIENIFLSRFGLLEQIYWIIAGGENKTKPVGFVSPPTNEICFRCHEATRVVSPGGDIIIPHQFHVKKGKLKCVDCHQKFVCLRSTLKKTIVPMEHCMACHDGLKATDECKACHTEKSSPKSHWAKYPGWIQNHGGEAKANRTKCDECHIKPKGFCNSCHWYNPVD